MASFKDPAEYQSPPRHWPFPTLGRNAFLAISAFLLALILFPFWGSIAVAAVFAFGLTRGVDRASRRMGNRRRLTAALVVGGFTLLLLFPATFLGLRAYDIATDPKAKGGFSPQIVEKMDSAYSKLESFATRFGVGAKVFADGGDARESLRKAGTAALTRVLGAVSMMVTALPEITVAYIVFALSFYGFLAYPREIKRFAFRLHLFRPSDLKRSIRILQTSSHDSLVTNFLVGAMQASIITFGAWFLGYREAVLIFSVVFALSFIPFIGAAPVGYALALLMLLNEGTSPALVMAAIATFTGVVDNVARSYLVSNGKNEVHPILSFAAILGAIGVLGLKGIFLGPVILTSTVAFLGTSNARKPQQHRGGVVKAFRRLKSEWIPPKHPPLTGS